METKELIKDGALWAGLNKPGIDIKEADVVIFGLPYDGAASFRTGAKEAPRALREITYSISPTTEDLEIFSDLKVLDLGDCNCQDQETFFKEAEEMAYKCVSHNKFFIMIGGDHSTTIPVHQGVDKALKEDFGIIHIDAHLDLCDSLDGNKYSHGSTQRRALELSNVKGIESIYFLGIRSIERDEIDFYQKNPLNILTAKQIRALGYIEVANRVIDKMKTHKNIYITVDIDGLDPAYAAGTGTPQFGGMDARELLNILEKLFKELNVIGMDIVEVAPPLDPSLNALFAARKIVTESWGHWYRKNKGFK